MNDQALTTFRQHVLEQFPKEACGVLVGDTFFPCVNVADDPKLTFRIAPAEIALISSQHGPITAILHSHPYVPSKAGKWPAEWPSSVDIEQWIHSAVRWGIVSTDGTGISRCVWLDDSVIPPLVGRLFVHGVTDCYAIIRDYFRLERGITLPNYPRNIDWWDQGKDLYSDNFKAAGFVEIKPTEVQVGDCVMFKVPSTVNRDPPFNHAAVITGPNEILHHLFHRPSAHDKLSKWQRLNAKYVRYMGTPQC